MAERKAFNFFKSYYDVFNELEKDKDKLLFVSALLKRQFKGTEPTHLTGMAKFAYISQKFNIDSQVEGFENKTKTKLIDNQTCTPPPTGGAKGGSVQEKGKVEEKEKGKDIPTPEDFVSYALEKKPDVNQESVNLKYQAWIENDWKDGNNKDIKNWKSKLLNTLPYLKDEKTRTNNRRGFESDTTRDTIEQINSSFK